MASGSSSLLATVEKLRGRENYSTWAFAMQNYFDLEELSGALDGTETDKKRLINAKAKLIMSLDPINYVHIKDAATAKDVWIKLKATFDDTGVSRRIALLRTLITTQLENCESMEAFVNKIIGTAHQLKGIGFDINDEWIGSLLLAGLPEKYEPMIMGIEHSGDEISSDRIKSKLLNLTVENSHSHSAFFAKKKLNQKSINNKSFKCFKCGKKGHFANKCLKNKQNENNISAHEVKKDVAFGAVFLTGNFDKNNWYIDSGASKHMTMRREWLSNISTSSITEVTVANDMKMDVASMGKLKMKCDNVNVTLNEVLYVPNLTTNLLSVSEITSKGFKVIFYATGCNIVDENGEVLITATKVNNVYKINRVVVVWSAIAVKNNQNELWHRRLAHINTNDLIQMKNGSVSGIVNIDSCDFKECETCLRGKQARAPFKNIGTRSTKLLEIIHADLCGPMENDSVGGAKYYLALTDDFSRKVFVFFLKSKNEVTQKFVKWKRLIENQTDRRIKIFRSDGGTEFCNQNMNLVFENAGIRHQITVPYTPQQNGLAERMNRTLVEKARCLLFDADLPKRFWAEAINTAAYLINRSIASGLNGQTPEEVWSSKKPDLSHLRVFGSDAMVMVPKQKRRKWDSKSNKLKFVGYCEDTKGYRLIDVKTGKITISRDVVFFEKCQESVQLPLDEKPNSSSSVKNSVRELSRSSIANFDSSDSCLSDKKILNENKDDLGYTDENTLDIQGNGLQTLRRSERTPKLRNFEEYVTYFSTNSEVSNDPITVTEAMNQNNAVEWKNAMKDELKSLEENNTWELVNLPVGKRTIKSKWVFKTKRDVNGDIQRFKARLVVKGYSQKEGIDYNETFSPVVRYTSIRFLIALAVKHNLNIDQMDAITAFLQGDLTEEIYLEQPEEFNDGTKKVCRLKKAMYGLKQSSREWNKKLDEKLKNYGLLRLLVDPCVYYKISKGSILIVAVYVDDFMIFTNNEGIKVDLKKFLMKQFKMRDLGKANCCVGLHITYDDETANISINQENYTKQILEKFGMSDCKPCSTPVDVNQKLTKEMSPKNDDERTRMSNIPYQEAVGSLLYLVQGTRPDIAFAVNNVSRYNNNYGAAHWTAVKRIFRYLKSTLKYKLTYGKDENLNQNIVGFTDADWASETDDRKSCTGYVFILQNGAISWNSRRQQTVALSSTEAEYMALSSAVQEALWLKQFEQEINLKIGDDPIEIYCDNQSALCLAECDGFRARSKHIDVRHHFIRDKINDSLIKVFYLETEKMIADSLTKAVVGHKHNYCSVNMGLSQQN